VWGREREIQDIHSAPGEKEEGANQGAKEGAIDARRPKSQAATTPTREEKGGGKGGGKQGEWSVGNGTEERADGERQRR